MSQDLDELFGAAGEPRPRTRLVLVLLVTGLLLAVLGLACSSVPGGLIVLAAWAVIDKETERVESGYLPADSRASVKRVQRATFAGLLIVLALFAVQLWLFSMGFYAFLWEQLLLGGFELLGLGQPG